VKARLLICFALLFAAALPTTAAQAVEPNGSFIRLTTNKYVYRIVGGAPLRIWQCTPLNNCAGVKDVPNLTGYRPYPADGAIVRSLADGGTYRFAGGAPLWISSCGYAPTCAGRYDLNNLADTAHIRAMPADGTVVRNVNDGGFYRFAGGAPLLPGSAAKLPPQLGGVPGEVAKPLKALGAAPPDSGLAESHCAPKKVTDAPVPALRSPIAKPPRLGKA
jgi:hypothetical protein